MENGIVNTNNSFKKKHLNKTYAFHSQVEGEGEKSPDVYHEYAKNNKLQKLFNPVLCETSRDQEQQRQFYGIQADRKNFGNQERYLT